MPSTHKKVIVRKMDRDTVSGYVSPEQFVHEGKLEVLNTSGTVIAIDLREIKGVYFVREFGDSESLTRKTFTSRPRSEGLWVRLRFKDSEILEGTDARRPDPDYARRISGESSGPAIEHAANFCAAYGAGIAYRAGRDRSYPPAAARGAGSAASAHVRRVDAHVETAASAVPRWRKPSGCE